MINENLMGHFRRATLLLSAIASIPIAAQPITHMTVRADKQIGTINEKVYGQFLEPIYHSVNGGLWGDLIWNRSFELPPPPLNGEWRLDGTELSQEDQHSTRTLLVGDYSWEDYDLNVDLQNPEGAGEVGIQFRVTGFNQTGQFTSGVKSFYQFALGGTKGAAFTKSTQSRLGTVSVEDLGLASHITVERDHWYHLKIHAKGRYFKVWVDGKLLCEYTDYAPAPFLTGKIALVTSQATGRFRALTVVSTDGTVLTDGFPEIPNPKLGTVAAFWHPEGDGHFELSNENPFNSRVSQLIESTGPAAGVSQGSLDQKVGDTYHASFWARGDAPAGLQVRVTDGEQTLFERTFPSPGAEWKEFPFDYKVTRNSTASKLSFLVKGPGRVWLDQFSVMPESARKMGGFRPDLLEAAKELHPSVIRWPGGGYASVYDWEDGIGPQAKRRSNREPIWDDIDPNAMGTDEFMDFSRRMGAEPLLVLNLGLKADASEQPKLIQHALDWIEYCNGPVTSKFGRQRAQNGHPAPYNVRYWELDNEWYWSIGEDRYLAKMEAFASAIRARYPSLRLIATGGMGYAMTTTHEAKMLQRDGPLFDEISLHRYEQPPLYAEGPDIWEDYIEKVKKVIRASSRPDIGIFASEWNGQSIDWRVGLFTGGLLNAFERQSDVVWAASPALFFRHVSGSNYNNALINFDNHRWFPGATYSVMKLWRDHYAPRLVQIDGVPEDLNVVATQSADGARTYVKIVNSTEHPRSVRIHIQGKQVARAKLEQIAPDDLLAQNTFKEPTRIISKTTSVSLSGRSVQTTLPRWSATVITISSVK